jgi:hypothetical protein
VAEPAPTPAELIERLRLRLGENGKPLSDDKLARLVGVPMRQQVIDWRKGRGGMSRSYAERFAELDGEHTADDYMRSGQTVVLSAEAVIARLDRLEAKVDRLLAAEPTQLRPGQAQGPSWDALARLEERLTEATSGLARVVGLLDAQAEQRDP